MLYSVMYHYVRDLKNSRYPKIRGLDVELFREQIRYFKKNFHIVTMEEVMNAYENRIDLPEDSLLLTFDDGYVDHFQYVFPILMEEGVQGSFFIPGEVLTEHKLLDVNKIHFVLACGDIKYLKRDLLQKMQEYREKYQYPSSDSLYHEFAVANRFDDADTIFVKRMLQTVLPEQLRGIIASQLFKKYVGLEEDVFARELYLTKEQVACMKQCGMFIGVHGYEHYWLGRLEPVEMKKDIEKGLHVMKDFIDPSAWVMNYPYGDYSDEVIRFLKDSGCKLALATSVAKANPAKDNPYCIPRFDTNDFPPKSEEYKKY